MFEMWMDIGGFCQEEFKMYMENPWRAPAIHPSTELNFVKPPMVDREGVIMCPNNVNMFGVPSKFNNYREQGRSRNLVEKGVRDLTSSLIGLNKMHVMGVILQHNLRLYGQVTKFLISSKIIIIFGTQPQILVMCG